MLSVADQRVTLDISSPTINNISGFKDVTRQSRSCLRSDARNSCNGNATVRNVLRHDDRHTFRNIVRGMQLTSEWTRLNYTTAALRLSSERAVSPPLRDLTEFGVDEAVGKEGEQFGSETEAAADGFGRLAAYLGADGLEVDKPGLEDRTRDSLQRFVHAAVQFDLVVEGAEDVGDALAFPFIGQKDRQLRHILQIERGLYGSVQTPINHLARFRCVKRELHPICADTFSDRHNCDSSGNIPTFHLSRYYCRFTDRTDKR